MRAILFDVFGTLVDWRSSLIEQFRRWSANSAEPCPAWN